MIVNKLIKETFKEISKKSLEYVNSPTKEYKYIKRLLYVFKNELTEDEQIYVFRQLMEQLHFRSIITDPDNIIQIYNIKFKFLLYIFILIVGLMISFAMIFKVNDDLNSIVEMFTNIVKFLSL